MSCLKLTYRENRTPLKVVHGVFETSGKAGVGVYRYGFNGMEKDNEVKGEGNSYTTEFRQYDPRLGRWLSVDPLAGKREWLSPYNFVQNNPLSSVDKTGAIDEFVEMVDDDGTSTKTKVSDLGGDKVDFTHVKGGEHDGQTRIESRTTGEEVYTASSKGIEGYTQRPPGTNWSSIFKEFTDGTGPENSLITNTAMIQSIMLSPQFGEAAKAYMAEGAPDKMGYNSSFGIPGAIKSGSNMTAQMIGKSRYSFYNVGDQLVIFVMDSKSIMSYSLNPLVKMLPDNWVNKDRNGTDIIPESTTNQTYLIILPLKK